MVKVNQKIAAKIDLKKIDKKGINNDLNNIDKFDISKKRLQMFQSNDREKATKLTTWKSQINDKLSYIFYGKPSQQRRALEILYDHYHAPGSKKTAENSLDKLKKIAQLTENPAKFLESLSFQRVDKRSYEHFILLINGESLVDLKAHTDDDSIIYMSLHLDESSRNDFKNKIQMSTSTDQIISYIHLYKILNS